MLEGPQKSLSEMRTLTPPLTEFDQLCQRCNRCTIDLRHVSIVFAQGQKYRDYAPLLSSIAASTAVSSPLGKLSKQKMCDLLKTDAIFTGYLHAVLS